MEVEIRKLDHIRVCLEEDVECKSLNWFHHVYLVHKALPEVDFEEVNVEVDVFGKKLNAPIIVAGMTGGHEKTREINEVLAEVVEDLGLGMGVGSQRAGLEDSSLTYTYSIVREKAPNALIIGNLGFAQFLKGYGVREVERAVEMVDADAIAIHLNSAQEIFQPEGDVKFKGGLRVLREIVESVKTPVIVKETGCGISLEVAYQLSSIPIAGIDVGGAGGTSWIKVEGYRLREKGLIELSKSAKAFSCWGIPTPASIIEARIGAPKKIIISTGGVRSGLDVAKSIALGADLAGIALPALKEAVKSKEALKSYLERLIFELKVAMVLTGSKSLRDLKRAPLVLVGALREWLEQRGVDVRDYLYNLRMKYNK